MNREQIELAKKLRELSHEDGDWEGSGWCSEAGGFSDVVHTRITDMGYDYSSLVSNVGEIGPDGKYTPPVWTHMPMLLDDATEGCVRGMLRRMPGWEGSHTVLLVGAKWGVFHQYTGFTRGADNALALYDTEIEVLGHTLIHAKARYAAAGVIIASLLLPS